MSLILILAILGCIPGAIASSKGRSFGAWWLYGALLFIVALIHSLCLKKDHASIEREQIAEGLVKCPYCAEMIKPEAIKCKHCGSDIIHVSGNKLPKNISNYNVTRKIGGEIIIDGYKVKDLSNALKEGNERKAVVEIMDEYSSEIDVIKSKLPDNLLPKFDALLSDALKE